MAKRKAAVLNDDAYIDSVDEPDDGYNHDEPEYIGTSAKAKRRRTVSKKSTKTAVVTATTEDGLGIATSPHSKNKHILSSPPPIDELLRWYAAVRDSRGMPWRIPFDPSLGKKERSQRAYEVWVSEIMLQQTQVATVIPYYNNWMSQFPSIQALAASTLEQVNSVWKGLGYYSRASRLFAGAQKVVKEYGGLLPDNAEEMQANIPGIGRYSAGAICSIAYGERVPVLDGNVHRLLSRLLALHAPPKSKATLDVLWKAASDMVQNVGETAAIDTRRHPGDINQALIELGSTICKVRDPLCGSCPLRSSCLAYDNQEKAQRCDVPIDDIEDLCELCVPILQGVKVTSYPMKVEKKKSREEMDLVNVLEWRPTIESAERLFLLVKRPSTGLLAGLLEFPTLENFTQGTSADDMAELSMRQISRIVSQDVVDARRLSENEKLGISDGSLHVARIEPVSDITHIFSHIRKTYRVQWILLVGGQVAPSIVSSADVARKGAKKTKRGQVPSHDNRDVSLDANWIRLGDVEASNITTGVLKIWNSVKLLWSG